MSDLPEHLARINDLATGFTRSQILFAAVNGDVFSLLEEERTAGDVAAAHDWSPRGARMLLDGLVALDLVNKAVGGYRNAPVASACLVPGCQAYQGNIIHENVATGTVLGIYMNAANAELVWGSAGSFQMDYVFGSPASEG